MARLLLLTSWQARHGQLVINTLEFYGLFPLDINYSKRGVDFLKLNDEKVSRVDFSNVEICRSLENFRTLMKQETVGSDCHI